MSRFAALDLTTLPEPSPIVPLDYAAILEARLVELEAQLQGQFDPPKVADIMALARNIAASPMRYLNEAAAARELYLSNRVNEAVRAIFLSTARAGDLDQIGANRGVLRRVLDDTDPDAVLYEADDVFRARIQLVLESYSPHGTEGSYVYWALDADPRVVDVVAYGPNSDVTPAALPAQPKIVILSSEGDGTATPDLIDAVTMNLTPDKRRPVADKVTVLSATPVPYTIAAILHVTTPEAVDGILAAARANAVSFTKNRLRIGRKVYRSSLAAAMSVKGVIDVEIVSPAADVPIGPYAAPHCTEITLTADVITGGWREI